MTTFCIEIESKPDQLGRQSFTMFWAGMVGRRGDEAGVRAQCFFTSVESMRKRTIADGHLVVLVESRHEAIRLLHQAGELSDEVAAKCLLGGNTGARVAR
jgi:hypothetical protein